VTYPHPGTYVGVDPGQRGAIARVTVDAEGRVVAHLLLHGRDYHGRQLRIGPCVEALREAGVVEADGVAVEALGLRPGEGVRATATAAASWAVWQAALDQLRGPGRYAVVDPQRWGRVVGLRAGLGRPIRKAMAVRLAAELLGARACLVPPRGREPSDGAADAVLLAYASGRGF
jgi:hypothetical protein